MTDILLKSLELSRKGEEIPITDSLLAEYADYLVDMKNELIRFYEERPMLLKGEEVTINAIGWYGEKTIHISNGIELLANALDREVMTRPHDATYKIKKYFMYRTYMFFELAEVKDA